MSLVITNGDSETEVQSLLAHQIEIFDSACLGNLTLWMLGSISLFRHLLTF